MGKLFLIHIFAYIAGAYGLYLEYKVCKDEGWWWTPGAIMFLIINAIPIMGIFTSIALSIDSLRNISKHQNNND